MEEGLLHINPHLCRRSLPAQFGLVDIEIHFSESETSSKCRGVNGGVWYRRFKIASSPISTNVMTAASKCRGVNGGMWYRRFKIASLRFHTERQNIEGKGPAISAQSEHSIPFRGL
jgi:hypothetical protein